MPHSPPSRSFTALLFLLCALPLLLSIGCDEQPAESPVDPPPTEEVLEYRGVETPAELDRVSAHIISNQLLGALSLIRRTNPWPYKHPEVVPRTPSVPWEDLPPGTESLLDDAAPAPPAASTPAGSGAPVLRIPFAATRDEVGVGALPLTGVGEELQIDGDGICHGAPPLQTATYEARIGGNTGVGRLTQAFTECSDDVDFTHDGNVETLILASAADPEGSPSDRIATRVEHHFDGFEYDHREDFDTRLALKGTIRHRNDPDLQELHTQIDSLVLRNRIDEDMTLLLENVEERVRFLDDVEYRSLSGRFYSEDHGWVDFELAPSLRWGGGPSREPTLALFLRGAATARVVITLEAGRGPAIELDQDGNGTIDSARLASRHTRPDDDFGGGGGPQAPEAQADRSSFDHLEVATTVHLTSAPSQHTLPGLFTQRWVVVSAPEGEPAVFSDSRGFSTEVTLIERGDYELALTVHDGERGSTAYIIAMNVKPEQPFWSRVNLDIPGQAFTGEPWQGQVNVRRAGDPYIEYEITNGPEGLVADPDGTLRWDDPSTDGRFFESFEALVSMTIYNGFETVFLNFSLQVHTGADEPIIRSGLTLPKTDSAIQIADFDGDGQPDILVSDASHHFYALSPDGSGGWMQSWVLPLDMAVRSFHAIDADADDAHEVYLHHTRGVLRLDGATREQTTPIQYSSGRAHGIRVADVDADSQLEIVTLHGDFEDATHTTLSVHDLATGDVEWSIEGTQLGERLRVGQLDADPALEIVLDGYGVVDGAGPATPGGPHPPEWDPGIGLGNPFDVGDVDEDGIDEIVVGERDGDDLRVLDAVGRATQLDDEIGHSILDIVVADTNGTGPAEVVVASDAPQDAIGLDVSGSGAIELWAVAHGSHSAPHLAVGNIDGDAALELAWAAPGDSADDQLVVASSAGVEWFTPDTLLHASYFVGGQQADLSGLGQQMLFAAAFGLAGNGDSLHLLSVSPDTGEVIGSPALRSDDWTVNGSGHGIAPGSFLLPNRTELAFLADGGDLVGPPLERVGFFDFGSEAELAPYPSDSGQSHPRVGNADADALDELFVIRGTGIAMLDPNSDRSAWEPIDTSEAIIDFEVADLDDDGDADLLVLTPTRVLHYEWVADELIVRGSWTDSQPLLHLELGDANGDGDDELVLTNGALAWILSPALVEITSYSLPYPNHRALVVDADSPGGPGILLARTEMVEVDAMTGALRWVSPDLIGNTMPESLHLHDDGEGGSFISIGTTQAIYVTR